MLVPAEKEAEVVAGLTAAASALYPSLLANPDYTAVINDRHFQRLTTWIDDARARGAEVIAVNPANEDFATSNARKMPLHIIRNPTDDMTVMQEEIFGPILPVLAVDGVDEATAFIGARPKPLAFYVFGEDGAAVTRAVDDVSAGGICVNQTLMHLIPPDLPFGGVGDSGMGAYHGKYGFDAFSHRKSVLKKASRPDLKLLYPPYKPTVEKLVKRIMR
jgi:coniferyl-aldehyde dehydrogenase